MRLQGCKINILGDSITEGTGTSDSSRVFWKLLERRDGAVTRGYGIGGTRIARQKTPSEEAKFDRHFVTRVGEMDKDADLIIVFGGTNDYGHGDAPLGAMTDRTDDTFYGALHHLYTELLLRYPHVQFLILTPLHRAEECSAWNEWGLRNVGTLGDYVRIIREVAAYYGLPVLDLYRVSGIQPEIPAMRERYMPDGLHPNDAGNERIYQILRAYIERLPENV